MLPDGVYKTLVILIDLVIKSQLTIIKRLKKLIAHASPWVSSYT